MFFDVVELTLTYIQYLGLLINLTSKSIPPFFTKPLDMIRYAILDVMNANEDQQSGNPFRVTLPPWLPLDIRLQFVSIAVIGPLVLSTLGLLIIYGKPVYLWFVCVLATLFMFLFGFIVLANTNILTTPASSLPSKTTLGLLSGLGLPCFALLLTAGLLCMGRARLRRLRSDALELERLIDEEQQRRQSQRITQQLVDRQGIDLVVVAAEGVHAKRREYNIAHGNVEDTLLQGAFVLVLLIGSFVLLGVISIPAIHDMQQSAVFTALGSITLIICAIATVWWVMGMSTQGRRYLDVCSSNLEIYGIIIIVTLASSLYITVITNFIGIVQCVPLSCAAGSRLAYLASLYPWAPQPDQTSFDGRSTDTPVDWCLPCHFVKYVQRCPTAFLQSLCAAPQQERRLAYDPRVPCKNVDGFFVAGGVLILIFYLLLLPYLQLYVAQYGVQMLQDAYPLEQRYYKVFTEEELYIQKVLISGNSASFAYRAYKPQYRFYRLSFLLQKIVLAVVGCVMQREHDHSTVWVGMLFFLVVPLIGLCCAVYLQPFSRPTEALYFPSLQAMLSIFSCVSLVSWRFGSDAVPRAIWILLATALLGVPAITLVVGAVLSLREERRWDDLLEKRLVQEVTDACVRQTGSGFSSLRKSCRGRAAGTTEAVDETGANNERQRPLAQGRSLKKVKGHGNDQEVQQLGPLNSPSLTPLSTQAQSSAAAVVTPVSGTESTAFSPHSKFVPLDPVALTVEHPKPKVVKHPSPVPLSELTKDLRWLTPGVDDTTTLPPRASRKPVPRIDSLQNMPGFLDPQTWLESLNIFCAIAIEAVAAPFLLFRSSDPKQQQHNSVDEDRWVPLAAREVETDATTHLQQACRSTPFPATSSILSLAPLFQRPGEVFVVNSAAGKDRPHGDVAVSPPSAGLVSDAMALQHRRIASLLHQEQASNDTNAVRRSVGCNHDKISKNRVPILTPSGGGQQAQLPSEASRLAFDGGTGASRSPPWMMTSRGSLSNSLSCSSHPPSTEIPVRVTAGYSHQKLLSPHPPPPPPPQQQQQSPTLHGGREGLQPCGDEISGMNATAGEYAWEATETFIPSLYFAQRVRPTRWLENTFFHQNSADEWLSTSLAPPQAGVLRPCEEKPAVEAIGDMQQLHGQTLIWARPSPGYASAAEPAPPRKHYYTNPLTAGGTACGSEDTAHTFVSAAAMPKDGAHPSGHTVAPNGLRRVLKIILSWIVCSPSRNASAGRSSNKQNGGPGAKLSFDKVLQRRHACFCNGMKSGPPGLCTKQELQQKQEVTRKAFWGNPTDAMLGVVDVPGSMTPWILFCRDLLTLESSATPARSADQPMLQNTMISQQRKYYMQLMEQQHYADVKTNAANEVKGRRNSSAPTSPRPPKGIECPTFDFELALQIPLHPVRTAARDRLAAAMQYHQETSSEGTGFLPLDTEMRKAQPPGKRCEYNDGRRHCSAEGELSRRRLSRDDGDEHAAGLEQRLNWLDQWGPLLMELLYESAQAKERNAPIGQKRMGQDAGGDSSSDNDSRGTDSMNSSRSRCSNPSSETYSRAMSGSGEVELGGQRRAQRSIGAFWSYFRRSNWGFKGKKSVRRLTGRGGKDRRRRRISQSPEIDFDVCWGDDARDTPPSPRHLSMTGRQPSMLLSLIMGSGPHQASPPATALDFAPDNSATQRPLDNFLDVPFVESSGTSSSSLFDHTPNLFFPGHDEVHLHQATEQNPQSSQGKNAAAAAAAATATKRRDSTTPDPLEHLERSAHPLIQQLRCLYLLRERLKESYWKHREQLTTVQLYVDYEIDRAVQRVLTFFLMVIGIVSTIALTLSFCGMLHTVDEKFISGVHRAGADVLYELAGYDSWDAFTGNCCCTAATQSSGQYPYYALDVEQWVCTNGVTKERVRRDGYDSAIQDGYTVRELCAMNLKNSCMVTVRQGTVTLEGCDTTAVSKDAMTRW